MYFSKEPDKTSDKDVFIAKIIPSRGAWLEFDVDKKDTVGVRIDRKRRQNVTVFLKALGFSAEEILKLFDGATSIQNTLDKDHVETQEEALEDIYRKLRPGEPPTAESAKTLLENLFFNPKRYDVARVGRHKVDKKLGAAEGVLLRQLRAHHKGLGELDNPDKKAWEQNRYRVFSAMQKEEAAGQGAPSQRSVRRPIELRPLLEESEHAPRVHDQGVDAHVDADVDGRRFREIRISKRGHSPAGRTCRDIALRTDSSASCTSAGRQIPQVRHLDHIRRHLCAGCAAGHPATRRLGAWRVDRPDRCHARQPRDIESVAVELEVDLRRHVAELERPLRPIQ